MALVAAIRGDLVKNVPSVWPKVRPRMLRPVCRDSLVRADGDPSHILYLVFQNATISLSGNLQPSPGIADRPALSVAQSQVVIEFQGVGSRPGQVRKLKEIPDGKQRLSSH
jgi:hypothetical protein